MLRALSYASGPSNVPLLGETIGDNLKRIVAKYPTHDALVSVDQDIRYTYSQFYYQTEIIAKALLAKGIQSGDRVGIWSANRAE